MKFFRALRLLYKKFFSKKESEYASYIIAEKISSLIYDGYFFSEYGKYWQKDQDFFTYYKRFCDKNNYHSADRKYFLRNLLALVSGLNGDVAECGVYKGASSYLMCNHIKNSGKLFYGFDSFEGLSQPREADSDYWKAHDLNTGEEAARKNLAEFNFVRIYKGWIPEVFKNIMDTAFCFVHIDVDLYQPTFDSVNYFYPRMTPGGVILCDDYGFLSCPGARQALDKFMNTKPEKIIEVPTGQSFIIKK